MTTRKERLGPEIVPELEKLVEPSEIFLGRGDNTRNLYGLEERRNDLIKACASEWGKVTARDDEDALWTQLIPQALFDTLESYSPQYAIIAAEAFLKQFGWKVERPGSKTNIAIEVADEIDRYNNRLNDKELVPTADDYNALLSIAERLRQ